MGSFNVEMSPTGETVAVWKGTTVIEIDTDTFLDAVEPLVREREINRMADYFEENGIPKPFDPDDVNEPTDEKESALMRAESEGLAEILFRTGGQMMGIQRDQTL
jgi:hypothetical protein